MSRAGNEPDKAALKEKAGQWISTANEKGFLENRGQMMDMKGNPVPFVLFKTEAPGVNIWITEKGLTIQTLKIEEEGERERKREHKGRENGMDKEEEEIKVYWERVDVELKGAVIKKENIVREGAVQGHFNYFYPHCPDGIYGVKEYERIRIKEVYPKIDWVLYRTKEGGFKYDFIVHAGGDYRNIELVYKSRKPIQINRGGEIEVYTAYGDMKEQKPVSY
ncbi:MAG: hypothetical protein D6799_06735, partial [Bacteroidetes bacterium]